MTYVVCEPCVDCKFTDCVEVCPVDCFYQGDDQLYISPDECIDCGACVPECPVEAIFSEDEVPAEWQSFIKLGTERWGDCAVITEKQPALPTADAKRKRLGK